MTLALAIRSSRGALAAILAATCIVDMSAVAERADDNAVTAANDAFGVTVGFQSVGLYGPTNARGFNPAQAENLRIEGLYYDQQLTYSNPFLFSRSDIKVGLAAQSYSFPSPTGIVDYKLRTPGDQALVSFLYTRGPLHMSTVEVDGQYPLVNDVVSVGGSVVEWKNFDYNNARSSTSLGFSLLFRIRPNDRSEIVPFVGNTHNGEHQEIPNVYANGADLVPMYNSQRLAAQDWTSWGWNQLTAGVIDRTFISDSWRFTAGVFRSLAQNSQNFNDLLLGPNAGGIAAHIVDATPPRTAGSYSGDFRLTRRTADGNHEREFAVDLRGRSVVRHFGGDSISDLGSMRIYELNQAPAQTLAFSASSVDKVRQYGVGASYNERWAGIGTLNLGVLSTGYKRTLSFAGSAGSTERTATLLPTASLTVDAGRYATAYSSYTRGLEDSVNAPASAVNRGESVPATPTWQVDAGIRLVPREDLKLLVGLFKVHKSYFNLDSAGQYGQLGDISSRGVEASATFDGLGNVKVVAGVVLLRTEVSRTQPVIGSSGAVPVGPVPRTLNINIDYAPARWGPWAADIQWTSLSSRVVTNDDRFELPPLSTLNVGIRYRATLFDRPFSARLDVANLTNESGLTISGLYAVYPILRRNYTLTVATDI